MKTLKIFFTNVRNSVYSPAYYATLASEPPGKAIRYFAGLSLFVAVTSAIAFVPALFVFFSRATFDMLIHTFPSELQIRVVHGQVSVNVDEPYSIPLPQSQSGGEVKNVLVIDTKSPFTSALFNSYATTIFLSKDFVVGRSSNGELRIIPLTSINDLTLDQAHLSDWENKLLPWLIPIIIILSLGIILVLFTATMAHLIYLLLAALVVMLIGKALSKKYSYKSAFSISVHAATFAVLMQTVLPFVGIHMFPFSFTLLFVLIVLLNIKKGATHAPSPKKL